MQKSLEVKEYLVNLCKGQIAAQLGELSSGFRGSHQEAALKPRKVGP